MSPKEKFADQQRECRTDIQGLEGGAQLVSPSPPGPSVPDSLCPLSDIPLTGCCACWASPYIQQWL